MAIKIAFFGSSEFASQPLQAIVDSGLEVVLVVTQPDRPSGRSYKLTATPVKLKAVELNLNLYQPVNVNSQAAIEFIKQHSPELIVVVAFGQFLSKKLLQVPPYGSINLHPSLLPKYRGAAPINWAIINSEKESGVTTILMTEEMDAGPIIIQRRLPICSQDNVATLTEKLSKLGSQVLLETIELIKNKNLKPIPQQHCKATYAPAIKKMQIDWTKPANQIYDLIRGTNPKPGAFTYYKNLELKIWAAQPYTTKKEGAPGDVIEIVKNKGFVVACGGDGSALLVEIVQPANRNKMGAYEYVKGYRLTAGSFLGIIV